MSSARRNAFAAASRCWRHDQYPVIPFDRLLAQARRLDRIRHPARLDHPARNGAHGAFELEKLKLSALAIALARLSAGVVDEKRAACGPWIIYRRLRPCP
jgi:hypothetical protein